MITGDKDGSNKQDSSKTRSDLSALIFEQLTLPIRDGQASTSEQGASGQSESPGNGDPAVEINVRITLFSNDIKYLRNFDFRNFF